MIKLIFALTIFFILTNVFTEWMNRGTLSWRTKPLSAYLAGVPYAWVQDVGYFGMAIGFLLLAWITGFPWGIAFLAATVTIPVVVITKYLIISQSANPTAVDILNKAHDYSAGIAFLGATVGLWKITWAMGGIPFGAAAAAPAIALLFMRFEPEQTTYEEKSYTAALMVSILSWCLVMLGVVATHIR